MKHVEYVQYIKDLQEITTIGFDRKASMKLSLALDVKRRRLNAREQSATEELLDTQKVGQHDKEAARERQNAQDRHRRDEERGLYAHWLHVRAPEIRHAHHEAIRYTDQELPQTPQERRADLKKFLEHDVHLPAAAVVCIVHQIPRALEVVLGMTDEQIRDDILHRRIYERSLYLVSDDEFDQLFSALEEKRQKEKLEKERRRAETHERPRNRMVYTPVSTPPRLPRTKQAPLPRTKSPRALLKKYELVVDARTPNPYCVIAGGVPAPGSAW